MVDLWARDTGIMLIITLPAVLVVLPLQLLLCFKARRRWVKRLPAILFAALTPALVGCHCLLHFIPMAWSKSVLSKSSHYHPSLFKLK